MSSSNPGAEKPASVERKAPKPRARRRASGSPAEIIAAAQEPLLRATDFMLTYDSDLDRLMADRDNLARIVAEREGLTRAWGDNGLAAAVAAYDEVAKSLAESPLLEVTRSLAYLKTTLEVGSYLDTVVGRDQWWQHSPLAEELVDLAETHLEIAGWAVDTFPARSLLADIAIPVEQWGTLVVDLPEHPDLLAPVLAGRTTTALAGTSLLVSLRDEDSSEAEEAVELVESTVLEPWEECRVEVAGRLYTVLGGFDATVPDLLRGAWDNVKRQGPAAAVTVAHLVVEVIDRTLRASAADDSVLKWHTDNGRSATELHQGRPTRSLRVKYLAREFKEQGLIGVADEALAKMLTEISKSAQGVKHASSGDLAMARSILVSAESLLVQLFLRD